MKSYKISSKEKSNSYQEKPDIDSREKFDSISSPAKLANQLQEIVDIIIDRCPDVDWNEDFISYQVIKLSSD